MWHRTTARGVLFLLLLWVSAGTAQAGPPPERIIFPVVGKVTYQDDFGDARGQGGHQGNDIMAPRRALAVAAELGCRTVAFPAISAGIYGWPLDDAARQAVAAVRSADAEHVQEVRFVLFGQEALAAFELALAEVG